MSQEKCGHTNCWGTERNTCGCNFIITVANKELNRSNDAKNSTFPLCRSLGLEPFVAQRSWSAGHGGVISQQDCVSAADLEKLLSECASLSCEDEDAGKWCEVAKRSTSYQQYALLLRIPFKSERTATLSEAQVRLVLDKAFVTGDYRNNSIIEALFGTGTNSEGAGGV